ncbi:MAG: hypothetical protein O7A04_03410 [Acidobacteria bacterium]|nr:hypothetical protein [Acidobacteriota bacterium]
MTYTVNATEFDSYFAAVDAAEAAGADVIETATGARRWTPPAPVSAAKVAEYNDRRAARDAYERMIA